MGLYSILQRSALLILVLGTRGTLCTRDTYVDYLEMSFFFDWNPPAQLYPVPVTQQCETINIKWSRGPAQGPNPVPPYYLQVYASIYTVPIVIPAGDRLSYDWAVPFPPGTLYQICMFDKNGNTGGCQDVYTVTPSLSSQDPTCANVTLPPQLEVEGIVNNGPISQYGWIEQCTDISVVPKGGSPPYTFTIAPSLHPPYNITGDGAMNWTVTLSWASSFFISVADSAGNMWANGLLHSGGPGTTECLIGSSSGTGAHVEPAVAIGAGVGGSAAGLLVGLLSMFCVMRRKGRKERDRQAFLDFSSESTTPIPYPDRSVGTGGAGHHSLGSSPYHVEPFVIPTEDGQRNVPSSPHSNAEAPLPIPQSLSTFSSTVGQPAVKPHPGAVYVLHHDNNAPPVTIYHEEGQEIVELPPRYPANSPPPELVSRNVSDNRRESEGNRTDGSDLPPMLQQQRRPNHIRKPAHHPHQERQGRR
ncbi:hypothetical protein CC2G_000826 [Coprinopsis cinerea AmutBmut pab1-1]|nr:hypothetical protein CC2G_000826 [Coprinopsis cinerea AmutBmut pab1-1]